MITDHLPSAFRCPFSTGLAWICQFLPLFLPNIEQLSADPSRSERSRENIEKVEGNALTYDRIASASSAALPASHPRHTPTDHPYLYPGG